jgi:hypothetical protein
MSGAIALVVNARRRETSPDLEHERPSVPFRASPLKRLLEKSSVTLPCARLMSLMLSRSPLR